MPQAHLFDSGPTKPKSIDRSEEIREVIEHYRLYHPRFPRGSAKQEEWIKIRARLEEGFSVNDLKDAIDGCHRSPFHCGENDRGRKYQSLELIVRNSAKVQQFMEVPEREVVMSEKERRTVRAGQQWLSRMEEKGCDQPIDRTLLR